MNSRERQKKKMKELNEKIFANFFKKVKEYEKYERDAEQKRKNRHAIIAWESNYSNKQQPREPRNTKKVLFSDVSSPTFFKTQQTETIKLEEKSLEEDNDPRIKDCCIVM